jgi:hypothetical protein
MLYNLLKNWFFMPSIARTLHNPENFKILAGLYTGTLITVTVSYVFGPYSWPAYIAIAAASQAFVFGLNALVDRRLQQQKNQSPDCFFRWLLPLAGSRKTVQDHIQKIAAASQQKSKKTALILEANGSWLDFPTRACLPKINKLAKTHVLDYCPIANHKDFVEMINSFKAKTYDIIWIRGHSDPDGVGLGTFSLDRTEIDSIKAVVALIRPNGKVILEGCNMGEGEQNFARDFSSFAPNATIYASDSGHPWMHYGLNLKPDGKARFKNRLGLDATRIYRNGLLRRSDEVVKNSAINRAKHPLRDAS